MLCLLGPAPLSISCLRNLLNAVTYDFFFLERENLNLTLVGYLPDCVSDDQNVAFLFQFIRCLAVRAELLKYSKKVTMYNIIIKHNPWWRKPHLCLPLDRELVWCRGPPVPGLVCSPGTSEKVIGKEENCVSVVDTPWISETVTKLC